MAYPSLFSGDSTQPNGLYECKQEFQLFIVNVQTISASMKIIFADSWTTSTSVLQSQVKDRTGLGVVKAGRDSQTKSAYVAKT